MQMEPWRVSSARIPVLPHPRRRWEGEILSGRLAGARWLCPEWNLLAGWMGEMPMPWGSPWVSSPAVWSKDGSWLAGTVRHPSPTIPLSHLRNPLPGHPFLFLLAFLPSWGTHPCSCHTSSPLPQGLPVASPGCRGRGALALGEIRSAGETSGSGFGGLSPVPALALTASSFVLLTA